MISHVTYFLKISLAKEYFWVLLKWLEVEILLKLLDLRRHEDLKGQYFNSFRRITNFLSSDK